MIRRWANSGKNRWVVVLSPHQAKARLGPALIPHLGTRMFTTLGKTGKTAPHADDRPPIDTEDTEPTVTDTADAHG